MEGAFRPIIEEGKKQKVKCKKIFDARERKMRVKYEFDKKTIG
jgi:hypothetical protein